jgi:L-ascorbate metabolism protein UlaG (beta-lactamase superfamily)
MVRVTWLGHSTVLLDLDDARVVTDPVIHPRAGLLRRTADRVDAGWVRRLDAVIISHAHLDHLDLRSLAVLPRHVRLFLPTGAARVVRRLGFENVQELAVGETATVGSLRLSATFASHSGRRLPLGAIADCVGYLVEGSESVYFAGDTALFGGMATMPRGLDLALLPIWGWGPRVGPRHMNPLQAAQALGLLQPRVAIPIHWGTLVPVGMNLLKPNYLDVPARQFAAYAADLAPSVEIRVLHPGEVTRV